MKSISFEKFVLLTLIGVGFIVLIKANILSPQPFQHFIDLADAFLNGQLHFLTTARSIYDTVYFEDKYFWPLGPFPAVLLLPFVIVFGTAFQQGYLQFLLILLTAFLVYKIAFKIIGDKLWAIWLSVGYIFSSAYIGVAVIPWSWQFAQVAATVFVLAALYEYLSNKRWWLVGLYTALAVAIRTDLILTTVFFAGSILLSHPSMKQKVKHGTALFVPVIASLALLFLYNFLRFHNFLDQGYTLQHLSDPFLQANRNEAVWGLVHIPANLYYFLFQGPDGVFVPGSKILTYPYLKINGWGMSILFTSPLFLWIVKAPFAKRDVQLAAVTVFLIAFSIFGYYGIGFDQFGYRYALDFYPFLFLILLYAVHKRPSHLLKAVIVFSFFMNIFLIATR